MSTVRMTKLRACASWTACAGLTLLGLTATPAGAGTPEECEFLSTPYRGSAPGIVSEDVQGIRFNVRLPEGYDPERTPAYPVLYVLHRDPNHPVDGRRLRRTDCLPRQSGRRS